MIKSRPEHVPASKPHVFFKLGVWCYWPHGFMIIYRTSVHEGRSFCELKASSIHALQELALWHGVACQAFSFTNKNNDGVSLSH